MKDFNLRDYLYNNPLLEAEKEDKEEEETPKGKKSKGKKSKGKKEDIKEEALRGYIREKITSILREQEVEDEDVDVDVEDTEDVDIDIEDTVDIEDEESEVDLDVDVKMPGDLSPEVEALQGLLTKSKEEAVKIGDEKLISQIDNTIIQFTRGHIAGGI